MACEICQCLHVIFFFPVALAGGKEVKGKPQTNKHTQPNSGLVLIILFKGLFWGSSESPFPTKTFCPISIADLGSPPFPGSWLIRAAISQDLEKGALQMWACKGTLLTLYLRLFELVPGGCATCPCSVCVVAEGTGLWPSLSAL